jgi:hypothetical protein
MTGVGNSRSVIMNFGMTARVLAALALVATLMVLPFAVWGYPQTPDLGFYASSWLETAKQWRQGILWPQWAAMANFGRGDPRLAFYPPLSQVIGGVICAVLPVKFAIGVYTWAILLLAGVCCHRFVVSMGYSKAAPLAAALYIANPYFMVDVHRRMAIPELLGCALLPLVLEASFGLAEGGRAGFLKLASIEALMWLTNIPAAIIGSLACGIIVLAEVFRTRSLRIVGYLGVAAGLAIALDAFYLLPVAAQLHWIQSAALFGYRPEDHYLFRWSLASSAVDIGVWEVGAVEALMLCFVAVRRRNLYRADRSVDRNLLLLAFISFVMTLPLSWPIWGLVPGIFRYIQFPWRWLMVLSLVFSILVPSFMLAKDARVRIFGGIAVALALGAGFAIPLQGYLRGLTFNTTGWERSIDDVGIAGYAEYLPAGATLADLPRGRPSLIRSAYSGQIEYMRIEEWAGPERSFDVITSQPHWLILSLNAFPRWHAYVNGVETSLRSTASGEAMVYAPTGRSHFDLKFEFTFQHWVGLFISLLALTGMILAGFYDRRIGNDSVQLGPQVTIHARVRRDM